MDVMAQQSTIQNWLAENPKMIGALFTIALVLAETGSVVKAGGTMSGP